MGVKRDLEAAERTIRALRDELAKSYRVQRDLEDQLATAGLEPITRVRIEEVRRIRAAAAKNDMRAFRRVLRALRVGAPPRVLQ